LYGAVAGNAGKLIKDMERDELIQAIGVVHYEVDQLRMGLLEISQMVSAMQKEVAIAMSEDAE
jgi:hypothetical protein